jgi:hypothetical protein
VASGEWRVASGEWGITRVGNGQGDQGHDTVGELGSC